jgi:hypothetical protein
MFLNLSDDSTTNNWMNIGLIVIGLILVWKFVIQPNKKEGFNFWNGTPATFFPRMYTIPNCLAQQNVEWNEKGIPIERHYDVKDQDIYFF